MTRPMNLREAFGYFGLMIGSLPPLAVVLKIAVSSGPHVATGLLLLIAAAGMVTSVIAFQLGRRYIPGVLRSVSEFSILNRVALWAVIGFFWGAISGAAGGLVIFLIGSVFAAIVGGIIGSITLPVIVTLYSSVRVGDVIETKHFLPIAVGVTLSVCAFFLGL
jgi:hypothetical protein